MTTKKKAATGEKYPTKKADKLGLGDFVMRPMLVTELRQTNDQVVLTFEDGSSRHYLPGEAVPIADKAMLPDEG